MSLGLPEFGSRGAPRSAASVWAAIRVLGMGALVYALVVAFGEWRYSIGSAEALDTAQAEVARTARAGDEGRRALQKNPDVLTATASVESSPDLVLQDLQALLPEGVAIPALKIDYGPEGIARVDITVLARRPADYDGFLSALAKSDRFADIRPGSETRPGAVRANVTATHRPREEAR